ncbi:MAG: type II toxin-antitoxin system RelE/ParE family toxin [Scytonema sp. PMC 1069.18]|nr:type II toxin-antitoxin system RelE/ParE family toxin [Scytonema sp. PMC 1069.18]MEC4881495.1 type II toxin-antitoxin system RelE/ParE family toxin [Scytonema sp. PMC 1070.18]
MSYTVRLTSTALEQIKKLDPEIQRQTAMMLEELAMNPRLNTAEKLEDTEPLYKIRLGEYCIIYQIKDESMLVTVVKVAHPRDY